MGTEARFEFKLSKYGIMNYGKSLIVSRISHIHQPNNSLGDRPGPMEPKDTKEGDGTQLTAESSTVTKTGATLSPTSVHSSHYILHTLYQPSLCFSSAGVLNTETIKVKQVCAPTHTLPLIPHNTQTNYHINCPYL
jgi:hypothetical protein